MSQYKTLEPQKSKTIDGRPVETTSELVQENNNNLSRLAKDFRMHQQNKERIQSLIALISNSSRGVPNIQFDELDQRSLDAKSLGAVEDYVSKTVGTKLP